MVLKLRQKPDGCVHFIIKSLVLRARSEFGRLCLLNDSKKLSSFSLGAKENEASAFAEAMARQERKAALV